MVATAPSLHALPRVPASKAPAAEGQPPAEDPTLRAGLRLHGAGHRLDALAAFNNDFGGWAGSPPQRVASLFSVEAGSQPQYRVRGHSLHYHAGLIRQQVRDLSARSHGRRRIIHKNTAHKNPSKLAEVKQRRSYRTQGYPTTLVMLSLILGLPATYEMIVMRL